MHKKSEIVVILGSIKRKVVILGSSNVDRTAYVYISAYKVSWNLTNAGFTIITGGGSGIMEAANRGAIESNKDKSACIRTLDEEDSTNKYISSGLELVVQSVYERNAIFDEDIVDFVVFPGGINTLQELFSLLSAFQRGIKKRIILVGDDFWGLIKNWLIDYPLKHGMISSEDMSCINIVNDIEDILEFLDVQKSI